jgi:hypothetical protein
MAGRTPGVADGAACRRVRRAPHGRGTSLKIDNVTIKVLAPFVDAGGCATDFS